MSPEQQHLQMKAPTYFFKTIHAWSWLLLKNLLDYSDQLSIGALVTSHVGMHGRQLSLEPAFEGPG